jgi:hypothetical protein
VYLLVGIIKVFNIEYDRRPSADHPTRNADPGEASSKRKPAHADQHKTFNLNYLRGIH